VEKDNELLSINKLKLLLIFLFIISTLISFIRLIFIDTSTLNIHESDGYVWYAKAIRSFLMEGSAYPYRWWWNDYTHKNRILLPLILGLLSTITFIPIVFLGVSVNLVSYLLSWYIIYRYYMKSYEENEKLKILILIVSSSTIATNFARFATDGLQTFLILVSVIYFRKWSNTKNKKNLLLSLFYALLSALCRESSILIFIAYFFVSVKKRKWRITVFLSLFILFVILSVFSFHGETILYLILRNIFLEQTARDFSNGIINIGSILTELTKKIKGEYLFHFFSSLTYSFFIHGLFGVINIIQLRKKDRFSAETYWILLYSFFLIFIYNGRILDRFFIPIFYFIIINSTQGIRSFCIWINEHQFFRNTKFLNRLFFFLKNEDHVWLFTLIMNITISLLRFFGTLFLA